MPPIRRRASAQDKNAPVIKSNGSPLPTPVPSRDESTPPRRRRAAALTRAACERCRGCKLRCEGGRPSCLRCKSRGLDCQYATLSEHETRMQALKRENDTLHRELDSLKHRAGNSPPPTSPTDPANEYLTPASLPASRPTPTESPRSSSKDSSEAPTTPYCQLPRGDSDSSIEAKSEPPEYDDLLAATATHGEALLYALGKVPIELSLSLLCSLRHGNSWEEVLEGVPSDSELQTMETSDSPPTKQESLPSWDSQAGDAGISGLRTGSIHPGKRSPPRPSNSRASAQSLSKFAFAGPALRQAHFDSSPWIMPMFDRQGYLGGQYLSIRGQEPSTYPSTASEMKRMLGLSPTWNMPTQSRTSAPNDPFWKLFHEVLADISAGHSIDQVCGAHAWASALYDEQTFLRAPKLTQLVVRLVKSIKPCESGPTLTSCAMVWIYWTLFRWMLDPSPSTFAEIPDIVRPTSWQIFTTHTFMVDTVLSPTLRNHLCENQSTDIRWCTSAWTTVLCDWEWGASDLLCRDSMTGEVDLSPICKSNVGQSGNWSMGPSVREYMPDVDRFFRIRIDDSTEERG